MRLTQKLPLIILCITIVASMATGLLVLDKFERELKRSELSQLTALVETRSAELQRYFASLGVALSLMAKNPTVREAVGEFTSSYLSLSLVTDGRAYLKSAFGKDHLAPVGKGEARGYAQYYRQVHKEFHPWFVGNLKDRGLYDLFLIDTSGNVVYSAKKETDFASDLKQDPMRQTGLAKVFQRIRLNAGKTGTVFSDVEIYQPSNNLPSGFIAAPIFSRHGNWIGVVALQFPASHINRILSVVAGMGETGETYLVGPDRLMRSRSRFVKESTVLKTRVDNSSVDRAFNGDSGRQLVTDYRGVAVYSAYKIFQFDQTRWALLAEIDEQEVLARIKSARISIIWIVGGITVLLLIIGTYLARQIAVPIRNVSDALTALSDGDLGATIVGKKRGDEIGRLISSFETLRQNERRRRQLETEVAKQHAIAQAALDNMNQALLIIDAQDQVVARNRQFQEMFPPLTAKLDKLGRFAEAMEELSGESDIRRAIWEDIVKTMSKGEPASTEFFIPETDLGLDIPPMPPRYIETRYSPLPDGGFVQTATDITERKKAEAELAEKEEILRAAMENMDQGLVMVDENQVPVARNRRYREMFPTINALLDKYGNHQEAVRNFSADTGLEVPGLDDMVDAAAKNDSTTFVVLTQGRHIEVRHSPLPSGGFVRTCTDATERVNAEAEIAAKEELLRAALDNMSDGIFMLDKEQNFRMFNRKYTDLTNIPEELVAVGSPIREVLKYAAEQGFYGEGDVEEQVAERLNSYSQDGYLEVEVNAGEDRINTLRKSDLPDGGTVVVVSDITERKRADENTRRILEASPTGVSIATTDGTLLFCNSRLAELFGTTMEDFMTRKAVNYWVDQEQQQAIYRELAEKKNVANREVLMRRVDGEEFWAIYSGLNFDYLGIPARMGWFYDITARKAAEDALQDAYGIINESVEYASKIQRSALPMTELLEKYFKDHFVIWQPRDIVGGDFYWQMSLPNGCLLAVADCTGHGVPGAFVTLIASGAIRHAIDQHPEGEPDLIIAAMNRFIKEVLAQYSDDSESDDGLELGVCRIYQEQRQIDFAGARFSLWHWTNGDFQEIKGDKTGVGYCSVPISMDLTRHEVSINEDSRYYLFSDGMVDQIGGERRRAFGKKRILNALADHMDGPLHHQANHIMQVFEAYQGAETRRDDVTLVGFRL